MRHDMVSSAPMVSFAPTVYKQFIKPTLTISQEPFLTYENSHNSDKTIVSITPLSGPSIANAISTIVGETDIRQPHIRNQPYVKCGTSLA